ncbi:MAG: ribonuclease III family protein [Promethearchaeota archaeon]
MRRKDLAKLGDSLTNLLYSLAESLVTNRFSGGKVSGKTLAAALRLSNLRHLAPSRLDAHGLGDSVEALIAYNWIRGKLNILEAATLLAREIEQAAENMEIGQIQIKPVVAAFAALLRDMHLKEQAASTRESQ